MLAFALLVIVLVFLRTIGGKIEGAIFPVTTGTQITQIQPAGDASSRIWGESVRVRDCSFVGINWYIGTPRRYAQISFVIEEQSKVRDQGRFNFGPWLLQANEDQMDQIFARAYHRCHALWVTETAFYP